MLVPRVDKKKTHGSNVGSKEIKKFLCRLCLAPHKVDFLNKNGSRAALLKKCLFLESKKKKTWCEHRIEGDFKVSLPDVEEWTEMKIRGRGGCSLYLKLHSAETRQNRGISLHIY